MKNVAEKSNCDLCARKLKLRGLDENRRPLFTVATADAHLLAIYAGSPSMTVRGAVLFPIQPKQGHMVTATASESCKQGAKQVLHWTTDGPLMLQQPHETQITFLMSSEHGNVQAHWTRMK